MAKKKPAPAKTEPTNNRITLIKVLIIVGTFVAIVALSIVTQGPNGGWASAGVITARIVLLSACTVVYFGMLYYTRVSRQNDAQKSQPEKK